MAKKHADTDLFFRGEFPEYNTSVQELEEVRKIKAIERHREPEKQQPTSPDIHLKTSPRKCMRCGKPVNGVKMSKYVDLYKCFACGSETFDVIVIKNAAK